MATVIYADDTNSSMEIFLRGEKLTTGELQEIVGGYIEIIALQRSFLIVNEDGKSLNLPRNANATEIARANNAIPHDEYILGNAVFVSPSEID